MRDIEEGSLEDTTPFVERLSRLDRWKPADSYALAADESLAASMPTILPLLAFVNSLYPPGEAGLTQLGEGLDPEYIDRLSTESATLRELNHDHLNRRSTGVDLWIGTADTTGPPNRSRFERSKQGSLRSWGGKPTGALYTSLASDQDGGMWLAHMLENEAEYPRPWTAWRMSPSTHSELIIDSAADWCEFVAEFIDGTESSVDWDGVAKRWDAVHLTPRAVFSIDCFSFEWQGREIPPSYWGVETTAWLNWCFDEPAIVHLNQK